MRKYRSNLYLLLGVIGLIVLGHFALDFILIKARVLTAKEVEKFFEHKLTIQEMFYVFPCRLVLKNVVLFPGGASAQNQLIVAPMITADISPFSLIARQRFALSRIVVKDMNIDDPHYFYTQREELMALISKIPRQNLRLIVKNAEIKLNPSQSKEERVTGNLVLLMEGDLIWAQGDIASPRFRNLPLKFNFKGKATSTGISLQKFILLRDDFYLALWGNSTQNNLQLKGYLLLDTHPAKKLRENFSLNLIEQMNSSLALKWGIIQFASPSHIDHYLLDIDSLFKITSEKIDIGHLAFTLNNTPFYLRGTIGLADPMPFELSLLTCPAQSKIKSLEQMQRAELLLKGSLHDNRLNSDGQLNFYLTRTAKDRIPVDKIKISFKNLRAPIFEYFPLAMRMEKGAVVCSRGTSRQQFLLHDAAAKIYLRKSPYQLIEFRTLFGQGYVRGRIGINTGKQPAEITSMVSLKGINMARFKNMGGNFSKINGRLDSQIYFRNYPSPDLSGRVAISDGEVRDFWFLEWFAKYFGLPSLVKIAFSDFSTNFTANTQRVDFEDIRLKAKELNLSGDFQLTEDQRVLSQFSLFLTHELMEESSELRPFLRLIENRTNPMQFDFQLSGSLESINFQWSPSALKQKIQSKLPNFIERTIERRITSSLQ